MVFQTDTMFFDFDMAFDAFSGKQIAQINNPKTDTEKDGDQHDNDPLVPNEKINPNVSQIGDHVGNNPI